jgi:hypothetical protein
MIAEQPKSQPGLPLTINFKIPADWTPEQATREWFRAFAAHSFLTCHPL